MPDLIGTQQLQATVQVAKSFILEQDTANIGTIITALGGSSTPAQKPQPTLSLSAYPDIQLTYQGNGRYRIGDYNESYGAVTFTIDTNHDGILLCTPLHAFIFPDHNSFTLEVDTMNCVMTNGMLIIALETSNFASKAIYVEPSN